MIAPPQVYPTEPAPGEDVTSALREMLSQYPTTVASGSEVVSELLYNLRYLPHRPEPFAVEAALEALTVEGEVLS